MAKSNSKATKRPTPVTRGPSAGGALTTSIFGDSSLGTFVFTDAPVTCGSLAGGAFTVSVFTGSVFATFTLAAGSVGGGSLVSGQATRCGGCCSVGDLLRRRQVASID